MTPQSDQRALENRMVKFATSTNVLFYLVCITEQDGLSLTWSKTPKTGFLAMGPNLPVYEGGSICNENPFITPSPNALGFYVICQT